MAYRRNEAQEREIGISSASKLSRPDRGDVVPRTSLQHGIARELAFSSCSILGRRTNQLKPVMRISRNGLQ